MAFLALLGGGGGGGLSGQTSQSAAIETGAFGGGTRGFGNVTIGSGSTSGGSNAGMGGANYAPYIIGAIALLIAGAVLFRR